MSTSPGGPTTSETPHLASRGRRGVAPWVPATLVLTVVGWGGNQFTPLMLLYRDTLGLSSVTVNAVLGVYVLGLIPALLLGGPASDRIGRRPVTTWAVLAALLGSAVMAAAPLGAWLLFPGRFITGVSVGLAMAAATSWVKELSSPPFDHAAAGAGARRASVGLTAGFGFGPVLTSAMAEWAPAPEVLPYLLHLAVTLPALLAVRALPEPSRLSPRRSVHGGPAAPSVHRPRFLRVVTPAAPWVFGVNAVSIAVVPLVLSSAVAGHGLAYATLLIALTFGAGLAVQPLARRLDDPGSARALLVALGVVILGLGVTTLTAASLNPWIGMAGSVVLGSSYGINLVSGLQEVQRIAGPRDLGALTGIFYALGYLGFLLPTVMAALAGWFDYVAMLSALTVLAALCLAVVARSSRSGLPQRD
ncbi:putative MFS family arabinose efflux permease [Georgenia soli]|uniref:Putative MFS family arabinose efflux permease n=1 Tax=Georgenia soli TaxID=638953 RepID=A0A2A9EJE1_9MICO|nr:MFS transporter [Georgenia soli]PFG38372.1 putative MFS family arabinose efflux permease [Georgenia soli]